MFDLVYAKQVLQKIPGKTTIAVTLIMILIAWLVLPHIAIAGSYPFGSLAAKCWVLGLAGIAWFLKLLITAIQYHRSNLATVCMIRAKYFLGKISFMIINSKKFSYFHFKNTLEKLRHDKEKRRLRKLPWYLVLGTPKSGKKSLIRNLGLYYAQAKHFGFEAQNYIKQFPDYDWWFSEQAVIIDAMSHIRESDSQSWKRFIKVLKRERTNKPLNGIILTFSLPDIVLYTNQSRQEFIQDICFYIREIHIAFKSQVPIYIIFTKADQVEGFMEFFNELSKDELRQIWGIQFPLSICDDSNKTIAYYHEEFTAIVEKLRSHVLWSLDAERNPRGRELIHSFPQQLQLLRRPIETFLMELFSGVRFPKSLAVRGIFFGSNVQEGEPHDFLLQAMSKKFQLVPPVVHRPQRMGECYFLQQIFQEVIYPELHDLGESAQCRKRRIVMYYAVRIGSPLMIILSLILMHEGYQANIQRIAKVNQDLTRFEQLQQELNATSDSLVEMLPMLNQLTSARQTYFRNLPIGMGALIETSIIKRHINISFERMLHNLFLPRVAAEIESALNKTILDQNLMYATLKAYLAFSSISNTSNDAIEAPLQYYWNQDYASKPHIIFKLQNYLSLALLSPVPKLPLDSQLISRIRDQLEAIIPSQRAYGLLLLKASVTDLPKLLLDTAAGENFSGIFQGDPNAIAIPALYTAEGYQKIFLPQYQPIATEVAEDNQAVGLEHGDYETQTLPQIITVMQEMYQRNYIKHWNHALKSIHIKPFTDLPAAINSIQIMIGSNSPFEKLFAVVYDNSNGINFVNANFARLNQFQNNTGTSSWPHAQQSLLDLQNYLQNIQQSTDPNHSAYNAILKTLKSGKSPIIDLTLEAKSAPKPIRQWLIAIANNSWNVLVSNAHAYINNLWQSNVMQNYNAYIAGRYPIAPYSTADLSIAEFNQFFSPNGVVNQFFKQYIMPFVQTDQPTWALYQIQGHSFQLSSANLALFQQASMIASQYFLNNSSTASLAFSIKPLTLDSNASSINFIIGHQSINYSHGPQITTNVNWPLPEDTQTAKLILSTFSNAQYVRSATGPWSIFKLLDQGNFSEQSFGNYSFFINIQGHSASYELSGSGGASFYQLTNLKDFNLPNNIAG